MTKYTKTMQLKNEGRYTNLCWKITVWRIYSVDISLLHNTD